MCYVHLSHILYMFFIFFVNTGIILESRYRMHEVGRDGAVLCADGVRMEKIC